VSCLITLQVSSLCLWPNVGSMFLSTEPSKHSLNAILATLFSLRSDTLTHGGIFPKCPYPTHVSLHRASICSMRLELVFFLATLIPPL
jgi:hypothetical protein